MRRSACLPPAAESSIGQAGFMTARTLVLLRHAKAETPGEVFDYDRRLAPRGAADAVAAGAWLAAHDLLPDLVLCSPAARTRQTWHGVAVGLSVGLGPALTFPVRGSVRPIKPNQYALITPMPVSNNKPEIPIIAKISGDKNDCLLGSAAAAALGGDCHVCCGSG